MIPLGLGSAGAVRVGHAVGAGDRARASAAGWTAILLGIVFMIACRARLRPRAAAIDRLVHDRRRRALGRHVAAVSGRDLSALRRHPGRDHRHAARDRRHAHANDGEPRRALAARVADRLPAVLRVGWGVYGIVGRLIAGLDRHRVDFVLRLDAKDQALSRAGPAHLTESQLP